MKRVSNSYRLQLIKEVATRAQSNSADPTDPMACYIRSMISEQREAEPARELDSKFIGTHFDSHAGGWVSDRWNMK